MPIYAKDRQSDLGPALDLGNAFVFVMVELILPLVSSSIFLR